MGQIDLGLTDIPLTPSPGKAGIFITASLVPTLIDENGDEVPLGGATNFIELLDVPSSYSGQGGKIVRVNVGGTALEFITSDSLYPQADERENNTVLFDKDYIIGNASARTGAILFSFTSAKRGATTEMRHDGDSITFPSQSMLMFDVAEISTTADNYFMFVITNITASSEVVRVFHALEGGTT
jgi:hypothetical protein